MIAKLAILVAAVPAHAFFYSPLLNDLYEMPAPFHYRYEVASPSPRAPTWATTNDAYVMNVRVPALEPDSLSATLMADDTPMLAVAGKRMFEGCECAKRVVETVPLPYRPRAEDISIELDNTEHVLSLRLARKTKATGPLALEVKVASPPTADDDKTATRAIRFVPHASATKADDVAEDTKPSVAERERSVVAKFAAALGSKATAAATEEPTTTTATPTPTPAPTVEPSDKTPEQDDKPAAEEAA